MLLKIVYQKQIHILDPKENTLNEVHSYISKNFKNIPQKYQIFYLDKDEDKISLIADQDLTILLSQNLKSAKIYIQQSLSENQKGQQSIITIIQNDQNEKTLYLNLGQQNFKEKELVSQQITQKQQDDTRRIQELKEQVENIKKEKEIEFQCLKHDIEQKQKHENQRDEVIFDVKCDECGISPIKTIRYKCGVCADYDMCCNCEEKIFHQHPLIKIRHLNQVPLSIKMKFFDIKPKQKGQFLEKSVLGTQELKYQSEEERMLLIVSHLQTLFGNQFEKKYASFAQISNSKTFEEVTQDFVNFMDEKNEKSPKIFKWIKDTWRDIRKKSTQILQEIKND